MRSPKDWIASSPTPTPGLNWPLPLAGRAQLRDWLILGLFDPEPDQDFALDYDYLSGEATIKPSTTDAPIDGRSWFRSDDFCDYAADIDAEAIDLTHYFDTDPNSCTVYAHAYVWAPSQQTVDMLVRSDDGIKVRLNGSQVWLNSTYRGYFDTEDTVVPSVTLVSGWNRVLLKIHNDMWGIGLACRFVISGTDNPVTGLVYQLNRPAGY
jgi:hypothetical protein